jgi:hypothetical protein
MKGSAMEHDEVGAVLDWPVLVSSASEGPLRVAYLNPDSATAAGVPLTVLSPTPVWTALRELPDGSGLVIDPEGDRLVFAPDEVDDVLGGPRAESPIISRRRRAELATRWVLFHKDAASGRPLSPVTNDFGQQFAFAWTDQQAATEALSPGLALVQVPLNVALRSNPDVAIILDGGSIEQLVIDQALREQILAATAYFPRGYLAFVAELKPDARRPYEAPARAIADAVRAAGLPLGAVRVVGYRLERAEAQIMIVVDADLDAAAANPDYQRHLAAIGMPDGPPVALMRRSLVPESYQPILDAGPDFAAPARAGRR